MVKKDVNSHPFVEGTITKLGIFEEYTREWIPTFVMSGTPHIGIFDFFAGSGADSEGTAGSPIRILQKVREQIENIFKRNIKVTVHLNEYEPDSKTQRKFEQLQGACELFLKDHPEVRRAIDLHIHNKDFEKLLPQLKPQIAAFPSLVFLDQNGIKYLSPNFLSELEKMRQVDFLCFVAASHIWRFGDEPDFRKYLPIDVEELHRDGYSFVHRSFVRQLRRFLPDNSKLKLYPFSLKKGSNIYGIVFGATHPRALDKFLKVAWKANNTNGEADYDIDDDSSKVQPHLFQERLTKIESFQRTINQAVKSKELRNNEETYHFCLAEGHIGRHAHDELTTMKKAGEIHFEDRSPCVTYEKVITEKRKVDFKVLKT